MEEEDIKRSMRFPVALYRRLEAIAKREHRTVLSQIVKLLEEGADRYEGRAQARQEQEPGQFTAAPSTA